MNTTNSDFKQAGAAPKITGRSAGEHQTDGKRWKSTSGGIITKQQRQQNQQQEQQIFA